MELKWSVLKGLQLKVLHGSKLLCAPLLLCSECVPPTNKTCFAEDPVFKDPERSMADARFCLPLAFVLTSADTRK